MTWGKGKNNIGYGKPAWNRGKQMSEESKALMRLHHKNHMGPQLKQRKIQYVLDYKKDKSCSLCGWKKHPEILQFHHTKRDKRNIQISDLVTLKCSMLNFKKAMNKCILLCPNCHVWHHHIYGRQRFS